MCSFIIVLFTMYEAESKSKVRLSVQALQSMHCETWLSQEVHTRHCCDKCLSGLVGVVFVYKCSL
jgi:hypothetical protein